MQVIKMTAEQITAVPQKHKYTEEELQQEYKYFLAQQMAKALLIMEL